MAKVFDLAKNEIKQNDFPDIKVGDVIKVHRRVKEGEKERIQVIEGELIARKHGSQPGATITIRRVSLGVGVELVFPLYSPNTEKIEIVKKQKVRRAKLYYIKRAKRKIKLKEDREALKVILAEEEKKLKKKEAEAKAKKEAEEAKEQAEKEAVKEEKQEEPKKLEKKEEEKKEDKPQDKEVKEEKKKEEKGK